MKVGGEGEQFRFEFRGPGISSTRWRWKRGGLKKWVAEEVLAQLGRETVRDGGKGNAAGVGGDLGFGFAVGGDPVEEGALDVEILCNGLDNPIAGCHVVEVVFEIAGLNQRRSARQKKRTGASFEGGVETLFRGSAAVGLIGEHDIEQQDLHPGVGKVGGDPGPHGPCSQNGNTSDECHDHRYLTVTRPGLPKRGGARGSGKNESAGAQRTDARAFADRSQSSVRGLLCIFYRCFSAGRANARFVQIVHFVHRYKALYW